jgi:predicted  nucleic acid-binding Zn-ribbon protein
MPATADNLRELHQLHQRAKALRDRLASAPKTLASRQAALETRKNAVEAARKAVQDVKVQVKKREHLMQGQQGKIDDLKVKLNQVKKNEEYKAIQNQIASDKQSLGNLEDEILNGYSDIEAQSAELARLDAEYQQFADEVAAFRAEVEAQSGPQKAQLDELEKAIAEAEAIIPEDQRERYRRTIKQHGADAMAAVEVDFKTHTGACSGCYVTITTQTLNEVINAESLAFCKTCGRVLYLAEEDHRNTRRTTR